MKKMVLFLLAVACAGISVIAFADTVPMGNITPAGGSASGIGSVAAQATSNLSNIAKLITAAAYVAGMAFAVGAIVKFKAHKDNPTQVTIGAPISLLFIGAALIFAPSVFKTTGSTLFGEKAVVAGVSGVADFGAKKAQSKS